MKLKILKIFLISWAILSIHVSINASLFSEDKICIEISSGKIKNTIFAINCNNEQIAQSVSKTLETTNRLKQIKGSNSISNMQNLGIDIFIRILLIENRLEIEIYDIMQKKMIRTFKIIAKNGITQSMINQIANEIYFTWFNEQGIFNTSIIFINDILPDLSILSQIDYSKQQILTKSSPISYLSSIVFAQNKIFLTKFCTKKRGFSIFSYLKESKQFFRILSIEHGCVFSPAIYQNKLYVSASNNGTTGVYEISLENKHINHEFKNFQEFEKDPNNNLVIKIPNKIATSINIYKDLAIYCCNQNGQPALFKAKLVNSKLTNHQQISGTNYYEPALFMDKKIAAIKTANSMFHLVIIDLATNEEKTLISKYYISQPAWSPCGNWIAFSAREKGEKDKIIIIHKSGKYPKIVENIHGARNPIWITNGQQIAISEEMINE